MNVLPSLRQQPFPIQLHNAYIYLKAYHTLFAGAHQGAGSYPVQDPAPTPTESLRRREESCNMQKARFLTQCLLLCAALAKTINKFKHKRVSLGFELTENILRSTLEIPYRDLIPMKETHPKERP